MSGLIPIPTGRKKPKNMTFAEIQEELAELDVAMISGDFTKVQNKRMYQRWEKLEGELKRRRSE